nr:hypothetical protein [Tanacetum cinerariifolium]
MKRFEKAIFKQRDEISGRMAKMFGLLKEITSSTTPEKVLVREEIMNTITKNVNAILFCRIERKKVEENNEVIDKNITEHGKCSIEEPVRITNKEPLGKERKMMEPPGFNDSLLATRVGKIKQKTYNELPRGPINDAILKKKITKEEDIRGNFVIQCNVGGLKYMDALVDQGSDMKLMPLSTYNRLTDEKLVETDIRLSLASQSYIYPIGIAEDMLVEIVGFVYPVYFVILDIKEDRKKLFILGMSFLMMVRAKIKFNKGTITLKSGQN